jgi:hypothetical protein
MQGIRQHAELVVVVIRRGPRNCRSLGFARDDKGDGGASIGVMAVMTKLAADKLAPRDDRGCGGASVRHPSVRHPSVQQPLSIEASPFPLSSRAKPRDLQFRGPLLRMF